MRNLIPAFWLGYFLSSAGLAAGQAAPTIIVSQATGQLLVDGKPMLLLAGELSNSAAGTAEAANSILPKLRDANLNTVLMPVTWAEIEPVEGKFDFEVMDHWVSVARAQHLHLVLLWFGSWKNAFSSYTPEWVRSDTKRFPRVMSPDGRTGEILSSLSAQTQASDARAFQMLMRHLRETDSAARTVLMVQVENEVGIVGASRDHSAAANKAFETGVPRDLLQALAARGRHLSPELGFAWRADKGNWREVFGESAGEIFTAWNYAGFVNQVVKAGKAEYNLPMFVNTQLPSLLEHAGEYPSGGPHPFYLAVWRAGASALDFFSPDIYWPEFQYWVERYRREQTPVFIPEARLDTAPFNALYLFGQADAFGMSPFNIDSEETTKGPGGFSGNSISALYGRLNEIGDLVLQAQQQGRSRGLVLRSSSPRASESVRMAGFQFTATRARSWPAHTLLQEDGGVLILQLADRDFLLLGTAMRIDITPDEESPAETAGFARLEEGGYENGVWHVKRVLNGDESDQGRAIQLSAHQFTMVRVRLVAPAVSK